MAAEAAAAARTCRAALAGGGRTAAVASPAWRCSGRSCPATSRRGLPAASHMPRQPESPCCHPAMPPGSATSGGQPGWSAQPLLNTRSVCPGHTCAAFNGCRAAAVNAAGGCGTGYISRFQGTSGNLNSCTAGWRRRGAAGGAAARAEGARWAGAGSALQPRGHLLPVRRPGGLLLVIVLHSRHTGTACRRTAASAMQCVEKGMLEINVQQTCCVRCPWYFITCAYTYLPGGSIDILHPDDLGPEPYLPRDPHMYSARTFWV